MKGCGHVHPSTDPRFVWVCNSETLHSTTNHHMVRVPAEPGEFDRDELAAQEASEKETM